MVIHRILYFYPMIWEDFIEIGYISKAHGIKGELKAVLDVHDVSDYLNRKNLWLAKKPGAPQPYELKKFQPTGKQCILAFKDIHTRNDAEALQGYTLLIPQSELAPLEEGQYFFFEILGFSIRDKQKGELGKVDDILEGGLQDLIVMRYKNKEVLIPAVDEVLLEVDKEKKEVLVDLPQGLLEMYVGEE